MKVQKVLFICSIAMTMAFAQEDTSGRRQDETTGAQTANTSTYSPRQVKIIGNLDFGQASTPVEYSNNPPYRAFVFSAFGGETVQIKVDGDSDKPFVALADSCLMELVKGTNDLTLSLPKRGPYIEVWYIGFRDSDSRPAHFTARVNKVAAPSEPVIPTAY